MKGKLQSWHSCFRAYRWSRRQHRFVTARLPPIYSHTRAYRYFGPDRARQNEPKPGRPDVDPASRPKPHSRPAGPLRQKKCPAPRTRGTRSPHLVQPTMSPSPPPSGAPVMSILYLLRNHKRCTVRPRQKKVRRGIVHESLSPRIELQHGTKLIGAL